MKILLIVMLTPVSILSTYILLVFGSLFIIDEPEPALRAPAPPRKVGRNFAKTGFCVTGWVVVAGLLIWLVPMTNVGL